MFDEIPPALGIHACDEISGLVVIATFNKNGGAMLRSTTSTPGRGLGNRICVVGVFVVH